MSQPEFVIQKWEDVDASAFVAFQKKGYKSLHARMKLDGDFISPAFYKWKYNAPAGASKVALAFDKGEVVAAVSLCPYMLQTTDGLMRIWQCCDGTTDETFRNSGVYHRILDLLHKSIPVNELMFGFPNQGGMSSSSKVGRAATQIPYWASVNLFKSIQTHSAAITVKKVDVFDKSFDSFRPEPAVKGCSFEKNAAYLNWRYVLHPVYKYLTLAAYSESSLAGFLVYREVELMGKNFAVIMELHFQRTEVLNELLLALKERTKCFWLMNLSNAFKDAKFYYAGFFKVPSSLTPKKQYFVVSPGRDNFTKKVSGSDWVFQTGDWDGL